MYERMLVPVDGSTTATRALQEGIKLADGKARLRLVYVIEDIYPLDAEGYALLNSDTLQSALRHTGERALAEAEKTARLAGAPVETALLEAGGRRVADVLGEEACHWQADLIVLGTHGRAGLNRLLLGSVAEGIARIAPVPVLLVRSE